MWSSYTESLFAAHSVWSLSRKWLSWRKSPLVHRAPHFDKEIKHCADYGCVESFLRSWPADEPPADQSQNQPRTNTVIFNPQTTFVSLIWPCFTLVTVLPICCLLALISQTASATAAAVRFISCSICGCVISLLEKREPLSLLELPEDKLGGFCNQSRAKNTTAGEAFKFKLLD